MAAPDYRSPVATDASAYASQYASQYDSFPHYISAHSTTNYAGDVHWSPYASPEDNSDLPPGTSATPPPPPPEPDTIPPLPSNAASMSQDMSHEGQDQAQLPAVPPLPSGPPPHAYDPYVDYTSSDVHQNKVLPSASYAGYYQTASYAQPSSMQYAHAGYHNHAAHPSPHPQQYWSSHMSQLGSQYEATYSPSAATYYAQSAQQQQAMYDASRSPRQTSDSTGTGSIAATASARSWQHAAQPGAYNWATSQATGNDVPQSTAVPTACGISAALPPPPGRSAVAAMSPRQGVQATGAAVGRQTVTPGAPAQPVTFAIATTKSTGRTPLDQGASGTRSAAFAGGPAAHAPVKNPGQQNSQTGTQPMKKYPDSLKQWIRRAFAVCGSEAEHAQMQNDCKLVITAAESEGVIWSRDWDTYPVPSVLVEVAASSGKRRKRGRISGTSSPESSTPTTKTNKQRAVANKKNADIPLRVSQLEIDARSARFARDRHAHNAAAAVQPTAEFDGEDDWESGDFVVQGCASNLEKSYLRLTSAPNPALVRPEPVLAAALERIITLISAGERDYMYYWSQLKAIRQDMTVQRIQNDLTVRVYETHARAALEYGDMKEYNNCATQLGLLYDAGCKGHVAEFGAYRILANSLQARCDSEGVLRSLRMTLAPALGLAATCEVKHAMAVRLALATSNWVAFWRLYFTAPHLGRAIMSQGVRSLRHQIILVLVKSWRVKVDADLCVKALGFLVPEGAADPGASVTQPLPGCRECNFAGDAYPFSDPAVAAEACAECLRQHQAVLNPVKAGTPEESWVLMLKESQGKIVLPEDKKAVAHGDANFSVDDFLSKVARS